MKIAIVINNLDFNRGGAEQSTVAFVQWLLTQGHEVHVVAEGFGDTQNDAGFVAHRVTGARSRSDFARRAEAVLRALPVDVAHDMGFGWYCDVFQPRMGSRQATFEQTLQLRRAWRRPLNRMLTGVLPRYRDFNRLMRGQYGSRDRLYLALSNMVAGHFRDLHGVPAEQIRVVYNGIDLEHYSPRHRDQHRVATRKQLAVTDNEVLIFSAAHNFPLKGVPALIRAAGRLNAEGSPIRLVLAGRDGSKARYRQLADQSGARVDFTGSIDNVVPYYAAADVFVLNTHYDPCSRSVLEAMACGLPVVTSRHNGVAELLGPEQGVVVENPEDDAVLADRIRPLFEEDRRERMGAAARRLAEKHSLEAVGHEMLGIYDEILERKTGHR